MSNVQKAFDITEQQWKFDSQLLTTGAYFKTGVKFFRHPGQTSSPTPFRHPLLSDKLKLF